MALFSRFLQLSLGLLATVSTTPIERRGTIASDEIVGFAQTVPSGEVGDLYLAYKPHLYVYNGCVPFPAVDAAGDTKYVSPTQKWTKI
jgi:Necrosis inducing protein (NPP1)